MKAINKYLIFETGLMILVSFLLLSPATLDARKSDDIAANIHTVEAEDKLSISIQDADIQSVLKALSIKKRLNIVAGQDVTGKISVNLYDMPLKDVLNAITTFNGFSYVEKDNTIYVTKEKAGSGEELPATEAMIFKLHYGDIEEVEKAISKLVSPSAKITVYKPKKNLIVEDIPENLERIKKVLEALDKPPKQVLIETRIMGIRLNDDTHLGIDWNAAFSGFINSAGNVLTKGFAGRAADASQGFFFNVANGDFNLFLDALQDSTEVKNLSSPSVLALDNKEAKIMIGEKLGYNVTTATDGIVLQSVEFLDTGTRLFLTPHIIDDGRVIMDIHPEVSDGLISNGLPSKNTTEVTTSLMAPDGSTIFIGGLIQDRKEDITSKVPGLGSLPVVGSLFSRTINKTNRTEIIVLITPHIISADSTALLENKNQNVNEAEKELEKERSLKELVPGIE